MYIKKIILSALIFGVSFPLWARVQWMAGEYLLSDECPKERPFKNVGVLITIDEDGSEKKKMVCTDCDEENILKIAYAHEQDFTMCSNRVTFDGFSYKKIKCSEDKPLFTVNKYSMERYCVSCNSDVSVTSSTSEECSKCPERIYEDGYCVLKSKPLGDLPCDFPEQLKVPPNRCGLCSNREYKDGYCVLKKCPSNTFKNEIGGCVGCESEGLNPGEYYKATEQECSQCPRRRYHNKYGMCILAPKYSKVKLGEKSITIEAKE